MTVSTDPRLVAVTRLFAELTLVEIDDARLEFLRSDGVREPLEELGLTLPRDVDLDELAVEFASIFLHPKEGAPPVQSLWTSGGYEGDAARAIRELAKVADYELDADASRHAAPDHAGVILILWCETHGAMPAVATRLIEEHVAWIEPALANAAQRGGFYGRVATIVIDLVRELRSADV